MSIEITRSSYILGSIATVEPWKTTLLKLSQLANDIYHERRNGDFFIRCPVNDVNYEKLSDTASLLIINADRRILGDKIVFGAPDPLETNLILYDLGIAHIIFACNSNAMSQEEIIANGVDSGGAYLKKYFRYKILIPCKYQKQDLTILLKYIFRRFHEKGLMHVDEDENYAWNRRCYLPLIEDEKKNYFYNYYEPSKDNKKELKLSTVIKELSIIDFSCDITEKYWSEVIGEWIQGDEDIYVSLLSKKSNKSERSNFTISNVLTDALGIVDADQSRPKQMLVAKILKSLGFSKVRVQTNRKREVIWTK